MAVTLSDNDIYAHGNDYEQTADMFNTSSYADGIYTSAAEDISAFNKRVINLPQSEWSEVSGAFSADAFLSPDYATVDCPNA